MFKSFSNRTIAMATFLACFAVIPLAAQDTSLVQTLVDSLGVTETQAAGGATAILGLAKSNLSGDDYLSIVKAVPEVGSLLGDGSTASTVGTLASAVSAISKDGEEEKVEKPQAEMVTGSTASTHSEGMEEKKAGEPDTVEASSNVSAGTPSSAATVSTLATAAAAVAGEDKGGDLSKAAGLAGLAGSFSDLGMDKETLGKFAPVILDYIGGKGGSSKAALLKTALGLL